MTFRKSVKKTVLGFEEKLAERFGTTAVAPHPVGRRILTDLAHVLDKVHIPKKEVEKHVERQIDVDRQSAWGFYFLVICVLYALVFRH